MGKKHSKRFLKAQAMVDDSKAYELEDAVKLLLNLPAVRFTESVEIAVRLGIDPKKTDQLVRGSVSLPNGTGKSVRIAVFAEGEKAKEAEAAGADIVGSEDLHSSLRRFSRDPR